jgi:hypothetical protein
MGEKSDSQQEFALTNTSIFENLITFSLGNSGLSDGSSALDHNL